jgi:uncharacterized peroxidase-related enzyme
LLAELSGANGHHRKEKIMSYLQLPTEETVEENSARLLREAVDRWGFAPNIVRAYALAPEVLAAEDVWSHGVMKKGFLPRRLKEAIATVVSRANQCRYCATAHSYGYKLAGGEEADAASILNAGDADVPEAERAALRFAQKATENCHSITQDDIAELKRHYSDGEIVEICAVIQQFMGYNWFVTMLGLEVEEENPARAWSSVEF